MKNIITKFLFWASQKVLDQNKPTIIAVTGSVGKTSTRNAIAIVLKTKFRVRVPQKNFNSEIGVPLTILNEDNPGRSVIGWLLLMLRALRKAFKKDENYPTHLVLEFGADRPGDISYLVKLAPPTVGVVTRMSRVHVENYPSYEALIAEKTQIVKHLPKDGLAVLGGDDDVVLAMKEKTEAKVVSFGFGPDAEIDGQNYKLVTREDDSFDMGETLSAIRFEMHDRKTDASAEVMLKDVIGIHQAYVCLAAAAVGKYFDISLQESAKALQETYTSPKGRLKPIHGIKGSLLLDDSYNSAPASAKAALDTLVQFPVVEGARRIAVFGHMGELGKYSEEEHRQVGWKAAELGVDVLVVAGEVERDIARGAIEAGMVKERVQ